MTNEYKIAVLLPTRGRTDALTRSVKSIVENVSDVKNIQIIFGIDTDDEVGRNHFTSKVQPYLDDFGVAYKAVGFKPMGYVGLNRYYNGLAVAANADWLFVWNDDAVMETFDWDLVVKKHNGNFTLLKIHTHNEHPYSIFPIYPKEWYDLFGFLARHQMIDAELSQIAYMLDLITIVDIHATHDRADITGNNKDDTYKSKFCLEGNPASPVDFHNMRYGKARMDDAEVIATHLEKKGRNMSFWKAVKNGTQDPWEKLKANDVNKQCVQRPLQTFLR